MLAEVNELGEVKSYHRCDAWGSDRLTSVQQGDPKSEHAFVGSLGHTTSPDTGLIYMRARYYDPAIGRFISEDPAGDGVNWYAYCGNNPANIVDASGKEGNWVWDAIKEITRSVAVDQAAGKVAAFFLLWAAYFKWAGSKLQAQGAFLMAVGASIRLMGGNEIAQFWNESVGSQVQANGGALLAQGVRFRIYSSGCALAAALVTALGPGAVEYYKDLAEQAFQR